MTTVVVTLARSRGGDGMRRRRHHGGSSSGFRSGFLLCLTATAAEGPVTRERIRPIGGTSFGRFDAVVAARSRGGLFWCVTSTVVVVVVVVVVTKYVNGATDRMARCRATFRNHIRTTAIVGTTRTGRILHAFIFMYECWCVFVCVCHAYMVVVRGISFDPSQ